MSRSTRRSVLLAAASIAMAVAAPAALAADDYPSKPIRIVVPYGAGTGLDVLTRSISIKLGEELKTSIVVENLAGSIAETSAHAAHEIVKARSLEQFDQKIPTGTQGVQCKRLGRFRQRQRTNLIHGFHPAGIGRHVAEHHIHRSAR